MIRNLMRRRTPVTSTIPSAMPSAGSTHEYRRECGGIKFELEPAFNWRPENSARISMPGGHLLRHTDPAAASELMQRRTGGAYFAHTDSAKWNHTGRMETKTRLVHAAVRRCVPWSICVTTPSIWRSSSDTLQGVAIWHDADEPPIIAVGTCAHFASEIGNTAHHEVWHTAERFMKREMIKQFDRMVSNSLAFGDSDYLDTPIERRARAYAAYAESRDLGLVYDGEHEEGSVHHQFERVYSGEFGEEVIGAGWTSVEKWMESGRYDDELLDFLTGEPLHR